MHRALTVWLAAALFLGLAAPSALAGGDMEGEGFRISVPAGFDRLARADRAHGLVSRLDLTEGMSIAGEPDVHVFCAGLQGSPDALLIAARIGLADAKQMRSRLDLQRYAMDHLRISEQEFDTIVADGGVELQPRKVGDYDALQMSHDGSSGALGLLREPATRALTVLGRDFVVVVVLLVLDATAVPVEATWQHVVRSVVIDPRGALVKSVLLYGVAGLAGLVLLVFLLRLRAQRKRTHVPSWVNPRGAPSSRAWDEDMSAPALHPAGGPPVSEAEPDLPPVPDGCGTSLPLPERKPAVGRARALKSSLASHQAEHPEAPIAPAPLPLVDEEPEGPPDLSPAPLTPPEPHPVPASELEKPLAPPAAPPARRGLVRTRRPDGRFGN